MARQDLLDATVAHLRTQGLGDASLREIAAAVGTSHRMLVYHFGNRAGLLAAVVDQVESEERSRTMATASGADPTESLAKIWAALSARKRADEERLFFELAARSLRDEPGTGVLREHLVDPWLEVGEALADEIGVSRAEARVVSRLDMAVIRGLLLDLLATEDRRGVNAAFRRYLEWRAASLDP